MELVPLDLVCRVIGWKVNELCYPNSGDNRSLGWQPKGYRSQRQGGGRADAVASPSHSPVQWRGGDLRGVARARGSRKPQLAPIVYRGGLYHILRMALGHRRRHRWCVLRLGVVAGAAATRSTAFCGAVPAAAQASTAFGMMIDSQNSSVGLAASSRLRYESKCRGAIGNPDPSVV
jgi:hypothetical protein